MKPTDFQYSFVSFCHKVNFSRELVQFPLENYCKVIRKSTHSIVHQRGASDLIELYFESTSFYLNYFIIHDKVPKLNHPSTTIVGSFWVPTTQCNDAYRLQIEKYRGGNLKKKIK